MLKSLKTIKSHIPVDPKLFSAPAVMPAGEWDSQRVSYLYLFSADDLCGYVFCLCV